MGNETTSQDALHSGSLHPLVRQVQELCETVDRHHRIAADARAMLHNGGAGPNLSQQKRIDAILVEIAGLPNDPGQGRLPEAPRRNTENDTNHE